MEIFSNEFFELTENSGKVFIKTFKKGFPIKKFNEVLQRHSRLKLTNFNKLMTVLQNESPTPVEIGIWLPEMDIEVSKDKMTANLIVYVADILSQPEYFQKELKNLLNNKQITHGIQDIDIHSISPGKPVIIAKGTEPIKGEDAIVTYLEIPERKPVIREDGRADYFDMNFIFEIKANDWLGEKIPAKPGINGQNVFGEEIPASPGKDKPLKYDRKSAYEVEEDGKIVIRALSNGVVEERQGLLTVNNHLPINGDVGLETGNIDFDGSISIRGTVQNGFSVIATGDLSIEGPEGVTGAKLIQSREGDIYIKGGIFGLKETKVIAGGSIYVKHVNEANLFAKKDIVIGFYSLNSHLEADSILVDENKGKIIGGKAIARNTIVTAISGNRMERRTDLIIKTMNRQEGYQIIQEKAAMLKATQDEIMQLTEKIEKLKKVKNLMNSAQLESFEEMKEELEDKKQQIIQMDHEIQELMESLKSVGKEEINVRKEAYPGTFIQIGQHSSLLTKLTNGTFKVEFGELNV